MRPRCAVITTHWLTAVPPATCLQAPRFRSFWTLRSPRNPGRPLRSHRGDTPLASRHPRPWTTGPGYCRHRVVVGLSWTDLHAGTDTLLRKSTSCLSHSIGRTSPWHWVSRHPRAEQLKLGVHCSWHRCRRRRRCCRKTLKHRETQIASELAS